MRQHLPDHPQISFAASRHGGPAIARTMTLARACGRLIKTLDADDWLTEGALARDVEAHANPGVLWSACHVVNEYADGTRENHYPWDPPAGRIQSGTVYAAYQRDWRILVHPATLCVRSPVLLALGGWMALPASEDTALLMALDACGDGYFITETGMIYRRWLPQMSASAEHVESYELDARRTLVLRRAEAFGGSDAGDGSGYPILTARMNTSHAETHLLSAGTSEEEKPGGHLMKCAECGAQTTETAYCARCSAPLSQRPLETAQPAAGGPPDPEDSLPGLPPAADEELDANGLPVQDRPSTGSFNLLWSLAGLIFGLASAGLGITEMVHHQILPGYLVAVCFLSGLTALGMAIVLGEEMESAQGKQSAVALGIVLAAALLGILGVGGLFIGGGVSVGAGY